LILSTWCLQQRTFGEATTGDRQEGGQSLHPTGLNGFRQALGVGAGRLVPFVS